MNTNFVIGDEYWAAEHHLHTCVCPKTDSGSWQAVLVDVECSLLVHEKLKMMWKKHLLAQCEHLLAQCGNEKNPEGKEPTLVLVSYTAWLCE